MNDQQRSMLDYAIKPNSAPGNVAAQDPESLRNVEIDDSGITDIVEIVSLLNFMDRVTPSRAP